MKKLFRLLLVICDVIGILALLGFSIWGIIQGIIKDASLQELLIIMMGIAMLTLMLLLPSAALLRTLLKPTYDGNQNPAATGFCVMMPSSMLILIPLQIGHGDLDWLLMLFLMLLSWMFFFFVAAEWIEEKKKNKKAEEEAAQ